MVLIVLSGSKNDKVRLIQLKQEGVVRQVAEYDFDKKV